MMITVCGANCSTCEFYGKECKGCNEIKGCVFWASIVNVDICPIYNCVVNEKKIKNCGECKNLPCDVYKSVKDTSMTDEEFDASVARRIENLKKTNS